MENTILDVKFPEKADALTDRLIVIATEDARDVAGMAVIGKKQPIKPLCVALCDKYYHWGAKPKGGGDSW